MCSYSHWPTGGPTKAVLKLAPTAEVRSTGCFRKTGRGEDGLRDCCPTFVDYLFIAFCTATAFSPTEALPLSPRAKLLMMLESVSSLVTIVAVAARAINILGNENVGADTLQWL